jgi:DNA-binding beta-propeller fold protein YncE
VAIEGGGEGTIEEFNSSGVGTLFASFGALYEGYPLWPEPTGLAFNSAGNLFVATEFNPTQYRMYSQYTIEEFNSSGVGTLVANTVGNQPTGLNQPQGMAFDSAGNLYVANYGNNTIEEFNTSGVGTTFASSGLDNPQDIAIQVPEPSTWAMVAMGLGVVFGGLRRSREHESASVS